ncbi:hypothetical protein IMX26_08830 [Clostridium sp. 'deep sea']|uniref:hypothetical protein n=1 Tax=Clostridium sp. 'deep sea' TaxID=2779445 RepID=UPI0018969C12|nr:hypothetical protein [Clostridium sp. 'deep sea']QOR33613.1 hypothetical protein IMX26_08830 [Clostridium sp. 'deep sea']
MMQKHFSLNSKQMLINNNCMHKTLCSILRSKKIEYQKLKYALIPNKKKKEVMLVFDSSKIENAWYSYPIFSEIIKVLDNQSVNSFLCGDYIDIINNQ